MKNIFFSLIFICLHSNSTNAQDSSAIGFCIGLGKSFYKNKFETDNNHFKFNNPSSITIGMQYIKYLSCKNQIVFNIDYSNKAIELEYRLNEPNIPYTVNDNISENYSTISFSSGYRRTFFAPKKFKPFTEIALNIAYNINDEIVSSGNGEGINKQEIPMNGSILFTSSNTNNLGNESFVLATNISVGLIFGKKKNTKLVEIYIFHLIKFKKKSQHIDINGNIKKLNITII